MVMQSESLENCAFIVFGASGDLSKRNLIPALYHLFEQKLLTKWALIGIALPSITVDQLLEESRKYIKNIDDALWKKFAEHISYVPFNITQEYGYKELIKTLENVEKLHGTNGNRLFYCATASQFFEPITRNLYKVGMLQKQDVRLQGWHKICYEKPFGSDLASAQLINRYIKQFLNENQVYRIDHFLAIDIVRNIPFVRMSNTMFKNIWDTISIKYIEIVLNETLDMEGRGAFYDSIGALKDVVQNHMLQLLTLVAMELPNKHTNHDIVNAKVEVFKHVRFIEGILGQYRGYLKEPGVNATSKTETFATLKFMIETKRWENVPFVLTTGKALHATDIAIYIFLKPIDNNPSDYLKIEIAPGAGYSYTFNAQEQSSSKTVQSATMLFNCPVIEPYSPEAYEFIFQKVISGDQSISVRFDEIEQAWQLIDAIKDHQLALYVYEKGGEGPSQAKKLFDFKKGK